MITNLLLVMQIRVIHLVLLIVHIQEQCLNNLNNLNLNHLNPNPNLHYPRYQTYLNNHLVSHKKIRNNQKSRNNQNCLNNLNLTLKKKKLIKISLKNKLHKKLLLKTSKRVIIHLIMIPYTVLKLKKKWTCYKMNRKANIY